MVLDHVRKPLLKFMSATDRWRSVSTTAPPVGEAPVRGGALFHLPLADVGVGTVSDAGRAAMRDGGAV